MKYLFCLLVGFNAFGLCDEYVGQGTEAIRECFARERERLREQYEAEDSAIYTRGVGKIYGDAIQNITNTYQKVYEDDSARLRAIRERSQDEASKQRLQFYNPYTY